MARNTASGNQGCVILRSYDVETSALNSAILHHQSNYKCPKMSDCPYTAKTLLEKRKLGDNEDGNEDFSDYRSEAARLASFTDWPVPFIQPADLASAGFFFLNRKDNCRY